MHAIEWIESWDVALAEAREKRKPIFLFLHAPT